MPGQHKFIALAPTGDNNMKTKGWWTVDFDRPKEGDRMFDIYVVDAPMDLWWHPEMAWTKVRSNVRYLKGDPPKSKIHVYVYSAPEAGCDMHVYDAVDKVALAHWWTPMSRHEKWLNTWPAHWVLRPYPEWLNPYEP